MGINGIGLRCSHWQRRASRETARHLRNGRTPKAANNVEMFAQYWPAVRNAVDKQQELIHAAHRSGIQVIFTRIATQTRDARDVGRQHRLVGLSVPRDSHEASPFNSTNIDHLLRNLGIDTR
jgi:nicotinamidase-related amidase